MIEQALAQNGYKASVQQTGNGRTIEYQLFARVTGQLAAAPEEGPESFARLAQAVHSNLELWTALAMDVASEGNGLPKDLRAKLFYLFEFTREHSRKVLDRTAKPDVLVDINKAIMRGLRGVTDTDGAQ